MPDKDRNRAEKQCEEKDKISRAEQKEAPKHKALFPQPRQIELHALVYHAGKLPLSAEQFAKSGAFSLVHFFFRQIKNKEQ